MLTAGALTPSGANATATYQWRRADAATGTYVDIGGANGSTHTLGRGDIGKYIKVEATGTDSYSGAKQSAAKGPITANVPEKPAISSFSPRNGEVSMDLMDTSDGGSAITEWIATANPGGKTGKSSTTMITVSGLTNGTAYTFTVKAKNAIGTSPVSDVSNPVTPGP